MKGAITMKAEFLQKIAEFIGKLIDMVMSYFPDML